ncbi:hypothetical protein FRC16_010448 [Serendipita sp. 398]|nr:hypothetical protein FRC16_010448 [Serendipita sp. 398]
MAVPVTVYAFLNNENEVELQDDAQPKLSEVDLAQAAKLVANARNSEAWITTTMMGLTDNSHEQCGSNALLDSCLISSFVAGVVYTAELQELQEFVNTDFIYSITSNMEEKLQYKIKKGATSQSPSIGGTFATSRLSSVTIRKEDPRTLLPKSDHAHEPWRFASKPEHKSLTRLGQRMPPAYVLRYFHPSMCHFYPELLPKHEEGGLSPLPNLPASSSPLKEEIEQWKRNRLNWIIPIGGEVPWLDASSGRVLFADVPLGNYNAMYPPHHQETTITWTPTVLKRFWEFILQHRNDGTLGPLSFAYFPAGAEKDRGLYLPDVIKVRCAAEVALKARMLLATFVIDPATNNVANGNEMPDSSENIANNATSTGSNRQDKALIAPLRNCRLILMNDNLEALLMA